MSPGIVVLLPGALLVGLLTAAGPGANRLPPIQQVAAALKVAHSDQYGAYLTDDRGRALYVFTGDQHGESGCYSDCARIWPPFVAASAPTLADASLDGRRLGAIIRSDGTRQVTYAGHPLYRYLDDRAGGPHGQKVTQFGGEWHLLSPDGRPIGS